MSDAWITAALVGSSRRTVDRDTGDSAIDRFVVAQRDARWILRAAGVAATRRLAGTSPWSTSTECAPGSVPPLKDGPAPPESRPACNDEVARLLRHALEHGPQWFADEILTSIAGQQRVVPHSMLVELLDRATTDAILRRKLTALFGARARWLARHRADWAGVVFGAADSGAGWTDGAPSLRTEWLRRLRDVDPPTARARLAEVFDQEPASLRRQFLSVLELHLGPGDLELVEHALGDRSRQVRRVARGLALRLESVLRLRAQARALAAVRRGTDGGLEVVLPELDDQLSSDLEAVERPGHLGPRAFALWSDVSATPPGQWTAHLGCELHEVVALFAGHEHEGLLCGGLGDAVLRFQDDRMAQILCDAPEYRGPRVFSALSRADKLRRLEASEALVRLDVEHDDWRLLQLLDGPWSETLFDRVLWAYRRAVRANRYKALRRTDALRAATRLGPPNRWSTLRDEWDTNTEAWFVVQRDVENLERGLRLRAALVQALADGDS